MIDMHRIQDHITPGRYLRFVVDIAKVLPSAAAQMLLWDPEILQIGREMRLKPGDQWEIIPELIARVDAQVAIDCINEIAK